jgi:membrane protein DedA with SNARE-associated domain
VLRALVPAIAGDARMPYRRFLFWNVLGALVSAPTVVVLGYVAGRSYHVVEKRLGQVSYVLVGLVVAFVVVRKFRERSRTEDDR